jgi:hypothetical protein
MRSRFQTSLILAMKLVKRSEILRFAQDDR